MMVHKKFLAFIGLFAISGVVFAKAAIDSDVLHAVKQSVALPQKKISILIFLNQAKSNHLVGMINQLKNSKAEAFNFMPVIAAEVPADLGVLNQLANLPAAAQISMNRGGQPELEVSAQAILATPSAFYPNVSNFWQHGLRGRSGVVGVIDSGIAVEHPALSNKNIIVRQEPGSHYDRYKNGVADPHGTGIACIYASQGSGIFMNELGIAHEAPKIVTGLAGQGDGTGGPFEDLMMTYNTLDWMLTRASIRPTVINYSYGNGAATCSTCNDWSGLAKIVDYVVNHEKILWIKSAGNEGWIEPGQASPYTSTITVPADNYNGITVANVSPTVIKDTVEFETPDRSQHAIRYTSSRGPTLNGRRKPDLSAPGHNTRTCAPDPDAYQFKYTPAMDYRAGYRLMGGTSSAAPHVGSAVLLLQDAGIRHPMAAKALLINSADAWTDSGKPGPDDPKHAYQGGHYQVEGSLWTPTYGWGYLNLQSAYEQREHIAEGQLTLQNRVKDFRLTLPVGGKVTLVHERRVGYDKNNNEWQLSHLGLQMLDADSMKLLAMDDSQIDTVHQVSNCKRLSGESHCYAANKTTTVIIRVSLLSDRIDGASEEPFALVWS